MRTTFYIMINDVKTPIVTKDNGVYYIINNIFLLLPNNTEVIIGHENKNKCTVGGLNHSLSTQYIKNNPLNILREDEYTNEIE